MKTPPPLIAARMVALVAIAASAGSVLFIFDGPLGWFIAACVFVVVALLWRAAICSRAPWPLPTAWHYACKGAFYVFSAEVLWAAAEWAAPLFVAAALGSELLLVHTFGPSGEHRGRGRMVSHGAGHGA